MTSPSPTIYLIRHGEKDKDPATGEDLDGLSSLGLNRAQQLVQVFGPKSPYKIGCILAQHPKKSGKRVRPYETVKPLAESLLASRPNLIFNHDIDRDDAAGVAAFIKQYISNFSGQEGNVLICWEHRQLHDTAKAIIEANDIGEAGDSGVVDVEEYPGTRFDVIWTMNAPYSKIDEKTSEHCTPQDDAYKAEGGWNYTTGA